MILSASAARIATPTEQPPPGWEETHPGSDFPLPLITATDDLGYANVRYEAMEGGTLTIDDPADGVLADDFDANNDNPLTFIVQALQQPPAGTGTVTFTNNSGEEVDPNEPVDPEDPNYSELVSHGTFIFHAAANWFGQTSSATKSPPRMPSAPWATVFVAVAAPKEKLYAIDGTKADRADGDGKGVRNQ